MQLSGGKWRLGPHLDLLNRKLMDLAAGRIKRLLVLMPPRHGKSELCSRFFPAWYLGTFSKPVMLCSYDGNFAASWGRKVREIIDTDGGALWNIGTKRFTLAASNWETTAGATMLTAGTGGSITGKGASLLIIDDPVRNALEAQSQVWRERTWNWFTSTAYSRLEPDGVALVIMTHWHEDDLAGRIMAEMEKGGEYWEVIKLPAICEDPDNDPLGRQVGEALWEWRYTAERLAQIKATMGEYWWTSLYQQSPYLLEGNILKKKHWRYYRRRDLPTRWNTKVQSWDTAFKGFDTSDYVVGQVWGKAGADYYLLDQRRGNWSFTETVGQVKAMGRDYPDHSHIYIEDSANGPAIIDTLRREVSKLVPTPVEGSKISRALAITGLLEAGNLWLPDPEEAPWVREFVRECAAFPTGKHDDQVDTMTQALLRLSLRSVSASSMLSVEGALDEDWEEGE